MCGAQHLRCGTGLLHATVNILCYPSQHLIKKSCTRNSNTEWRNIIRTETRNIQVIQKMYNLGDKAMGVFLPPELFKPSLAVFLKEQFYCSF